MSRCRCCRATRPWLGWWAPSCETLLVLERCVKEAEDAGLLGEKIAGRDFSFRIQVRRGAGAYICGEEGSLLNSLEGTHPFPRNRPPLPVTHGFENDDDETVDQRCVAGYKIASKRLHRRRTIMTIGSRTVAYNPAEVACV